MQQQIDELAKIAEQADCARLARRAMELSRWLAGTSTHVVVCGEFKRGKSSLVNALLGTDICPTDMLPETAVPAVFAYAREAYASVKYVDGRVETIEATRDALRRFSASRSELAETVRLVEIGIPSGLLEQGIVLIDTPGVNDLSAQRVEVTYGFLPLADVALVVLDATAPVTRTEADFLASQVLPNVLDRVVFILGKADRVDPEELDEVQEGARSRLAQITGRAAQVIPLSALKARTAPEALAPLRSRLAELAATNLANRARLAKERGLHLAAELEQELLARIDALDIAPEERDRVRRQAEEARLQGALAVDKIREYVELFGRKTLVDLVGASLAFVEKRALDDLLQQLSLMDGQIDKFVNKQLPHTIKRIIRDWSDAHSQEIEVFLAKLIEHLAGEFATAFAIPLQIALRPPRLQLPEYATSLARVEGDRVQELITHQILPTTAPVVIGMLLGGPIGMGIGVLVGRVAEAKIREGKVAAQKQQAEEFIRDVVPEAFDAFRNSIELSMKGWFDRLQETLTTEAGLRLEDLVRQVEQQSLARREPLEAAVQRVQDLKARMAEG